MTTITKTSATPKTAAAKDAIELPRAHHQAVSGPFCRLRKNEQKKKALVADDEMR